MENTIKNYRVYAIVHEEKTIYVGITEKTIKERSNGSYPFIPDEILKESIWILLEETTNCIAERKWIKMFGLKNLYNRNLGMGNDWNEYQNGIKGFRQAHRAAYNEYHRNYYHTHKRKQIA